MIRKASSSDLPAMAHAEQAAASGSQWTLDQLAQELDNPRAEVFVAESSGHYAGHAVAWFMADEVEIMSVTVLKRFQRQGLGRALLAHLLKAKPWKTALLELRESNIPARALYEKAGFIEVGKRKNYYRDGEDAILMTRANNSSSRAQ